MREEGVIIKIADEAATVEMNAAAHSGCKSCGVCRAGADGKTMRLDVHATEGLAIGDRVTVEIPGPGPALSAAIALLVPLVCFMLGLAIGAWLLPERHGLTVGIGFASMAASLFFVACYDRHLRRSPQHQPRIVGDSHAG